MKRYLYPVLLLCAGLMMCRDAATLAIGKRRRAGLPSGRRAAAPASSAQFRTDPLTSMASYMDAAYCHRCWSNWLNRAILPQAPLLQSNVFAGSRTRTQAFTCDDGERA